MALRGRMVPTNLECQLQTVTHVEGEDRRADKRSPDSQTSRRRPPSWFLPLNPPPHHPRHLPFCTVQCPASALRAERTHSGSLPRTDGYYVQFVIKGCYPAFWWKQRTLHCWHQQCPTQPNVSALCTSWLPQQQHPASFFELFISLCKTTGLHIPVLCWTHWVALGKSLSLSGPWGFHLGKEIGRALTFCGICDSRSKRLELDQLRMFSYFSLF